MGILLEKDVIQAKEEIGWLDGLSEIPFDTWDLRASSETWQQDYPDREGYTGLVTR